MILTLLHIIFEINLLYPKFLKVIPIQIHFFQNYNNIFFYILPNNKINMDKLIFKVFLDPSLITVYIYI